MKTITCTELKQKLDEGNPSFKLINALDPAKFRMKHIPHSINITTKEEIERHLDREDDIVVYCTDQSCNKSIRLYYLLEALGFKHIARFPGGLVEWEGKGLPVTGTEEHQYVFNQ